MRCTKSCELAARSRVCNFGNSAKNSVRPKRSRQEFFTQAKVTQRQPEQDQGARVETHVAGVTVAMVLLVGLRCQESITGDTTCRSRANDGAVSVVCG